MNGWTTNFLGADRALFDSKLSPSYKQQVLPLHFTLMQQVSSHLSELVTIFKEECSKLQDISEIPEIKEEKMLVQISLILREWKSLINDSWQMLFSRFKVKMQSTIKTNIDDPDENEAIFTADPDQNDFAFAHLQQEPLLRTQLNVDKMRNYVTSTIEATEYIDVTASQFGPPIFEVEGTENDFDLPQKLPSFTEQFEFLRVELPDVEEFQTDTIADDLGPFEALFDNESSSDTFIRVRIANFQTDLSDREFFDRLEKGWAVDLLPEYSTAKPLDDTGIDETMVETAARYSVGSHNSGESDFFDPNLETDRQLKPAYYSEPMQMQDFVKCKITGKIDRSQPASMTAIIEIKPVPQKDINTILDYLKNHPLIVGCFTETRTPSVCILRGTRAYAVPVEHVLPKHDLSTQEYSEELKAHLQVSESTVSCPGLFSMTEFQQVSSVAPFDKHTGPLDEPRLLLSSSNHIAVLCQQSGAVQMLTEPRYTHEVPPIGMRTCKSFDGKIAVFRVDVQPAVYKIDSEWRLNMFFTSEWHFYGRTFCNSWNCTDRGVRVGDNKLFFLGYDPSRDMQPHHTRKYPEIRARLMMVDFWNSKDPESASSITGVEDFLVESALDSKDNTFVVLRSDGEVLRIDQSWKIVKNQRTALKYLDQVSFWSALGYISGMLVAVGYINTRDRSAVMYYLLDKEIKMAGGVALEVPLRKMGSIAPPVIVTTSTSLLWKKRYHQETVNLLLAILGSGEIHVLGLKDKLFLLHKITSNESQNYCAASLCQVGDQIYTGGQLYLRKIQFTF